MQEQTTDIICPFIIDSGLSRGQAVRLGPSLDTMLSKHAYPEEIGFLISKACLFATLLSSTIKFEGVFTLQIQGKGIVSLLAVDVTTSGDLRSYARFDEEQLERLRGKGDSHEALFKNEVETFFQEGTLSFSVETNAQSYQGVVALEEKTLEACLLSYFKKSEQIETSLSLCVGSPHMTGKGWIAGAVMIQRMPMDKKILESLSPEAIEDLWQTSLALLHSLRDEELLDEELLLEKLLYRLYHLNDLHFFTTKVIRFGCRCSERRVREMLARFSEQDRLDMVVNERINVDCQFCGNSYTFTLKDLEEGTSNNVI